MSKAEGKKTGRPPKPPEERAISRVSLRFTDTDWAKVQTWAKAQNKTPTTAIQDAVSCLVSGFSEMQKGVVFHSETTHGGIPEDDHPPQEITAND